MKSYVAVLLQMMIWSGYSLAEWLSNHDRPGYNMGMFLIFVFLAFNIAKYVVKSTKASLIITGATLSFYLFIHWGMPAITAWV